MGAETGSPSEQINLETVTKKDNPFKNIYDTASRKINSFVASAEGDRTPPSGLN